MSKDVKQLLDFWNEFLTYTEDQREECVELALENLKKFKNGKISKDGLAMYDMLTSKEWVITGMAPNLFYFRVNSDADSEAQRQSDLDALWVHPFSLFTLVLKHKTLPLIILCNSNLMYNDTVLAHIDGNKGLKAMKNLLGHTG
jgi:hypothetical protein